MRAVTVAKPGGVENLRISEVPNPAPGVGEVLIRVAAAGVNRADLLQRQGFYPPPPGTSEVLGLEVSGVIDAVGPQVAGWAPGDAVVALLSGGGYAELVTAPAGQCVPPPRGVDLVSAAGLIEVAATVESNTRAAGLAAGDTLLVHGGAGGIGSFAIQYGKALGATVLTTAGTEDKRVYCRSLGADVAIDYHQDWVEAVQVATDNAGVDMVLDVMGAKYLANNISVLARDGWLVVIGLQGGVKAELDLTTLLNKNGTLAAASLRARPPEQKADIVRRVRDTIWPMIESGRIKLAKETRFDLADVQQAHEQLQSGHSMGKVLLTM